jgi:uncharacterized protein (TIGR02466 family)
MITCVHSRATKVFEPICAELRHGDDYAAQGLCEPEGREGGVVVNEREARTVEGGEDRLQMLFPTVVQVSQIEGSEELNRRLLAAVYAIRAAEPNSKPDSWSCNVYTTIGNPRHFLERNEFGDFDAIARSKVHSFALALKFDIEKHPPKINECWVNVYGRTHSQEIHLHQNSVLSGIYYVKAPPGSSPTLFYSPMSDVMLEPPATERTPLNNSIVGFDAVEGRMIMFRSSLRHSVLPSAIDEDRVTIAFNVTM